ncbi:hypothetical protein RJ55_00766 [Drechmeria coniospora]|nr:hypothetical protein RJ55_00766 [Drechmeria coniospora]
MPCSALRILSLGFSWRAVTSPSSRFTVDAKSLAASLPTGGTTTQDTPGELVICDSADSLAVVAAHAGLAVLVASRRRTVGRRASPTKDSADEGEWAAVAASPLARPLQERPSVMRAFAVDAGRS